MSDRCTAVRPLIHDYLEGELQNSRTGEVRDHLVGCRACRGHAEAWIEDLQLLLAVEETLPAGHWNGLRRKLRWRGQRAATHVPAWLQILCALAALALVFGAVGFLIWLESGERADGERFAFDVEKSELVFHLARGERCKLGTLELAAKTGAPQAKLTRLGTGATWELHVLWGQIALRKDGAEIGIADHEERWHLPVSPGTPQIELALQARWRGVEVGPWPKVRVSRRDGARAELVGTSDHRGRLRFEAPLRVEPPLVFEAEIDGEVQALDLPPLDALVASTAPLERYLEIRDARHLRRITLHDSSQRPVIGAQLRVAMAQVEGGPHAEAKSSEHGIVELPLWFAGPYEIEVLAADTRELYRGLNDELPESIDVGAH
ncbi:MAG: zf-HC2 domain-containing protein [Planctomycetes bacterium]|nr:zf-HC2 domain-containing protein [Planctomycetota bacterium]